MDIPVAAGPWLVLGVVLGILLPLLAALAVLALRRRPARPEKPPAPTPASAGLAQDDLPGFLESPPGSAPTPAAVGGWAALSSPVTPPPAPDRPPERSGSTGVLVAMAVTALVLIGAAAAVAAAGIGDPAADRSHARDDARGAHARTTEAARSETASARLTFGGVVLERHAVGVTVAYPRVRVSADGDRATAEVELPTFNCLRGDAPEDPVPAGCTRSVTEHAELSTPDLEVAADGAGLRLSGRFASVLRPNGSPPEATGRVYELVVRVAPRDGRAGEGAEPATGLLQLGDDRVATDHGKPNALTYGG